MLSFLGMDRNGNSRSPLRTMIDITMSNSNGLDNYREKLTLSKALDLLSKNHTFNIFWPFANRQRLMWEESESDGLKRGTNCVSSKTFNLSPNELVEFG